VNTPEAEGYLSARAERRLATDEGIHELGVHVRVEGGRAVVTGSVATRERKRTVIDAVRDELDVEIVDQLEVLGYGGHEDDDDDADDSRDRAAEAEQAAEVDG
jgi:BON domain